MGFLYIQRNSSCLSKETLLGPTHRTNIPMGTPMDIPMGLEAPGVVPLAPGCPENHFAGVGSSKA